MRRSTIGGVVALALLSTVVVMGQTPASWLGTWKANVQKSTYSPGPPSTAQSQVANWESLGGGMIKNAQETVDAKGQSTRFEIIFAFDGVDYPVKGAVTPGSTRAYRRIDDRTWEFVTKVNGKVTGTQRCVVAADGKTRTITQTSTNAQGQAVKNVVLWEKQ